jgi:hypothetical protein
MSSSGSLSLILNTSTTTNIARTDLIVACHKRFGAQVLEQWTQYALSNAKVNGEQIG